MSGSGGIGRRARFRTWWAISPCGFESHLPHLSVVQLQIADERFDFTACCRHEPKDWSSANKCQRGAFADKRLLETRASSSGVRKTVTWVGFEITPGSLPFPPAIGYAYQRSLFAPVRAKLPSIIPWTSGEDKCTIWSRRTCLPMGSNNPCWAKLDAATTTISFHRASCLVRCGDASMIPGSRSVRSEQLS